mmetsp:Transcript_51964/g.97502  ORF Transcript_51964/g.97502 Transcript_51964/m.97502 type:complete len:101 (-) Transcript_51964:170-472(-)
MDVVVLVDLIDHIFTDENSELTFADLMELVLQLRGTNTATVRDVVDLRKFLTQLEKKSNDHVIDSIAEMVAKLLEEKFEEKLSPDGDNRGETPARSDVLA